jgi:DNA-binding SARP family transcriptional activator
MDFDLLGGDTLDDFDFKFYGLGPFYCEYKGREIDGDNWVSKRAIYVLMYLLQERKRTVSAEELVDIFWPESNLEDGKNKLYNTIYLLRKSLKKNGAPKDIVESNNGGYILNKSYQIWTDWNHFEKTISELTSGEEISIEELKSLFKLYRGDYFISLKYEDWTEINREKIREYFLLLIDFMTNRLFKREKYRDVVNYLHKGIEYDPYRENFYLLYIKALVKLGRIAEAINSYKKCERILNEELNVPPSPELKSEIQRIKISREISEKVYQNIDTKPVIEMGAMFCDFGVFQKIYELELRHVKRLNKEFVLLTVDFTDLDLKVDFDLLSHRIAIILRTEDVISVYGEKIYIILKEMEVINSGIVMQRFNELCKELDLKKRPSLDIKEIT